MAGTRRHELFRLVARVRVHRLRETLVVALGSSPAATVHRESINEASAMIPSSSLTSKKLARDVPFTQTGAGQTGARRYCSHFPRSSPDCPDAASHRRAPSRSRSRARTRPRIRRGGQARRAGAVRDASRGGWRTDHANRGARDSRRNGLLDRSDDGARQRLLSAGRFLCRGTASLLRVAVQRRRSGLELLLPPPARHRTAQGRANPFKSVIPVFTLFRIVCVHVGAPASRRGRRAE